MNTNSENGQTADMLAFLAKRGVREQDCALAEQYLNGEAGDEVLDQFQRIDFASTNVQYDVKRSLDSILKGLQRSQKRAACVRLLNVLFAVGHGSCSALLYGGVFEQVQECALYKRIVVLIEHQINFIGYLRVYDLQSLMELAEKNPDTLREALEPLQKEGISYYLTALAVYFCMEYGKVRPIEAKDMALMKTYEDGMLDCLDEWLAQQGCGAHQEIIAAVRARQLTPGLLEGARQCRVLEPDRRRLCFLGSLAYLNFMLSDVLLDALRTCLAVDAEWVLCTISEVSVGTLDASRRISSRGGDYDTLLWIDPKTYIRWAAVEDYTHILQRQLEKNQDSYLRAMDQNGFASILAKKNKRWEQVLSVVNHMKDVILKMNPDLYRQTGAGKTSYDRVIDYLVGDTEHAELARAYLQGQSSVSTLYPYVEEFSKRYVSYHIIQEYRRHSDDAAFFNRCNTFMVVMCCVNTRYVEENTKNEAEQVEQFFRMLDAEKLDIAHQLGGFAVSYSVYATQRGCRLEPFVKGAVNVFGRYLDSARREETTAAFSGARAEGRYLALLVLKRDPARNRREILGYTSDSSKLVRTELLDILCAQRGWEDVIKTLLQAKRAPQRELAVQVIARWQQEGGSFDEALLQAVKREKNAKVLALLQDALHIQKSGQSDAVRSGEGQIKQLYRDSKEKSPMRDYDMPAYEKKGEETMNINADDRQINDMLSFLEKMGFTGESSRRAEGYLKGSFEDEVLDQFEKIDFSASPFGARKEVKTFVKGLDRECEREAVIRLLRILYAAGGHKCAALLEDCGKVIYTIKGLAPYQRMAIYIDHCTRHTRLARLILPGQWERMLEIADGNLEAVREAVGPLMREGRLYALIALTLYFNRKYQGCDTIAAEDAALMERYENMLLDWLDIWVVRRDCACRPALREAVRGGQLTSKMVQFMKTQSMSMDEMQHFLAVCSMAYLNYERSAVLKNIVKSCMFIHVMAALYSLENACIGREESPEGSQSGSADYEGLFAVDVSAYIRWAAMTENHSILKRQFEKHQEIFLKALDERSFEDAIYLYRSAGGSFYGDVMDAVNVLKDVIKQENPNLYKKVDAPSHERMIAQFVADSPHAERARDYLRGNCAVSELYPYEKEYAKLMQYRGGLQNTLNKYSRHCADVEFIRRCKVFLVTAGFEYFEIIGDEDETRGVDGVKQLFADLDSQQLDIAHQLSGFGSFYKIRTCYSNCTEEELMAGAEAVFADYLQNRREETLAAFFNADAEGRYLALRVMQKDAARNKQEILHFAGDSAKLVREALLELLCAQTDWADDIRALLQAKKAAQRETAVHVLSRWQRDGGSFKDVLLQALEKEKNAKVLALLQDALNIEADASADNAFSQDELVEQLHRGNRKKGLAWAYGESFSTVHTTDGQEASERYLQAVLLCYASQEKCGVSKNAAVLAEKLDTVELARYVNELFDRWLAAGAESKKRWVLYAASIHGGEEILQKLQRQIQEWPLMMRGAIAMEAVKALALNPSAQALLIVDGMSRKFKFKQVKAAAGEALEFAAAQLGITREELSDRIVPDLGFDGKMQRTFDYGARTFKVMLTPALDIEVFDDSGKKLKNMPAPGKKDDAKKAAAAHEDFKQMKKQMKTTVSSQRARLEYALSAKREWSTAAWTALFVRNPLMHQFAIGLIWGVYEDNRLTQSFRYMEDGTFNTQDEEEFVMPEGARISLVHPIELSSEERAAWKEQLADYEMTQPIEQLDRPVFRVDEEEKDRQSMERVGGYVVNDLSLNGKLTGFGWYRGSVQDGGAFYEYYREDAETGMGVELHFSGSGVGFLNEDVTVYDARFYKVGTVARGSYVYDEADREKASFLKDVPPRYFSEIVLQLTAAVASSKERDTGWKEKAQTL